MIAWSTVVVAVYAVLSDDLAATVCRSAGRAAHRAGVLGLARLLVECPTLRIDFTVLAAWGLVIAWQTGRCGRGLRSSNRRWHHRVGRGH